MHEEAEPTPAVEPPEWEPPDRVAPKGSDRLPVSITIPLYDEEENVAAVTRSLLDAFGRAEVPLTVILVDNGSHDGTRAKIQALEREEPRVRVVLLDKNRGYGGGILAGMETAEDPLLGYMWGDGQVEAGDVLRVYRRLVADDADLCKARRVERVDGWQREIVTRVYNTVTLWMFHVTSSDTNGCPKLFTRAAWEQLAPSQTDWFLDPEIMLGVAEQDLKLAEVDVIARARDFGISKVGAGTVLEFAFNMLKRRVRGRR